MALLEIELRIFAWSWRLRPVSPRAFLEKQVWAGSPQLTHEAVEALDPKQIWAGLASRFGPGLGRPRLARLHGLGAGCEQAESGATGPQAGQSRRRTVKRHGHDKPP